jgi:hypothetical protein
MRQALHAEWTKLRTAPGTIWLLLALIALTVALGAAAAAAVTCPSPGCNQDPAKLSLTGIGLGQAVVAILAVLAISGEYSTGMIHLTLTAMPRRPTVLAAKATILTGMTLGAGTSPPVARTRPCTALRQPLLVLLDELGLLLRRARPAHGTVGVGEHEASQRVGLLAVEPVGCRHRSCRPRRCRPCRSAGAPLADRGGRPWQPRWSWRPWRRATALGRRRPESRTATARGCTQCL